MSEPPEHARDNPIKRSSGGLGRGLRWVLINELNASSRMCTRWNSEPLAAEVWPRVFTVPAFGRGDRLFISLIEAEGVKNVVLVHGGFVDGSGWS